MGHSIFDIVATVVVFVVHIAVAVRAITRPNRTPASRVAWVAVIMTLPLVGIIAYLALGETSIGPRRARRLRDTERAVVIPGDDHYRPADPSDPSIPLFDLISTISGFEPVDGNTIALLGDPDALPEEPTRDCDAAIEALVAAIDDAHDTVHVCIYIWLDDGNGGRVADAVSAAARRGVTCRVAVDALGSRKFVRSPRWAQMREAGAHLHVDLNDIPRIGRFAVGRVDLRNHQKIFVIDNQVAFIGSQNCADPAFRAKPKYAPWIDVLVRCEGPVVRQVQALFLDSWISSTGEAVADLAAREPLPAHRDGGLVAQMFGTGPTTDGPAMSDSFVSALYSARRELIITTPYLIPDEALLRALCAAPRRGVATTLIVPARNDSPLVRWASRSNYADYVASGIQLYEYPLGLLHSKTITVDGERSLIGSSNMDRRSLELDFEDNMLITDAGFTAELRTRQLGYLSVSKRVDADQVESVGLADRLLQNAMAILSPLL